MLLLQRFFPYCAHMTIFLTLLIKIIPLYFLIALGFFAGRFLQVQKETIATLLIYITAPVVIFHGIVTMELRWSLFLLPMFFFILCCAISTIFLWIGGFFWNDSTKSILAFTSGTGNTGYFGLPVAVALLGKRSVTIVVLCLLGFILYENCYGFFLTARAHHSVGNSVRKLIQLPTIYAFFLGLFANILGMPQTETYLNFAASFRGTYTVLGMMMIGLGLSAIRRLSFDWAFVGVSFIAKFVVWPVVVLAFVVLDQSSLHLYDASIHTIMMLMSIVPLAANTVAFATELKAQPEKASMAVFLSTIFALFYIPFMATFF